MKEVIVDAEDLVCLNKEKLQELIRCKDCKYNFANIEKDPMCSYFLTEGMKADDFCSRAERKEE